MAPRDPHPPSGPARMGRGEPRVPPPPAPAPTPATALVAPLAAELFGTFILVFAITATAVAAGQNRPIAGVGLDSLAVVLANGLTLAALAAVLGPASGGPFNPAVSVRLAAV